MKFKGNQFRSYTWISFKGSLKRITLALAGFFVIAWSIVFGSKVIPTKVYAVTKVYKVVASTTTPPVLARIITCESGNRQFASNGQVLINVNTNGTVDIGIGQINSIWFKTAAKMGYDLSKESDNRSFTTWLFMNYGSEPWQASKTGCWSK